jgi:hypothetical protein
MRNLIKCAIIQITVQRRRYKNRKKDETGLRKEGCVEEMCFKMFLKVCVDVNSLDNELQAFGPEKCKRPFTGNTFRSV